MELAIAVFLALLLLFLGIHLRKRLTPQPDTPKGWRKKDVEPTPSQHTVFTQAKPPWVREEILRLKELMPDYGCRKIAAVCNRLYANEGVSVGKTFVSNTLRRHRYEILVLRNKIKHRKPPTTPRNIIWQVDLTGKPTQEKPRQAVLGMIDHGTRACIGLAALPSKATIRILITLLEAMEKFGTPKVVRTDNEAVFTSRLFRLTLWLLNIRHTRIQLHCPWQNGRIERMFLTLKQSLDRLEFFDANALGDCLVAWRFWYNHVRPHQHLDGQVPAEAWNDTSTLPSPKTPLWFEDET